MHIAIAIPTLNRSEKLKKALDSIFCQKTSSDIRLSICVSNSASTDDTGMFLESIKSRRENIHLFNSNLDNTHQNYGCLAKIIPEDVDWVWFMGDDDYLTSNESVSALHSLILNENQDLSFVHVCQKRRSNDTSEIIKGSVKELCNTYGYHEMLGWISSIVIKKEKFINAMNNHQIKANSNLESISAFNHSICFYQQICNNQGIFFDKGLIEPQDLIQTKESIKRWADEKIPEKYLLVMDDFNDLKLSNLMPINIKSQFFRYINFHFWDRWLIYLLNETVREDIPLQKKIDQSFLVKYDAYWGKLLDFCNIFEDKTLKKLLDSEIKSSMALCLKFLFDNKSAELCKVLIKDKIKLLQQSCYCIQTKII